MLVKANKRSDGQKMNKVTRYTRQKQNHVKRCKREKNDQSELRNRKFKHVHMESEEGEKSKKWKREPYAEKR